MDGRQRPAEGLLAPRRRPHARDASLNRSHVVLGGGGRRGTSLSDGATARRRNSAIAVLSLQSVPALLRSRDDCSTGARERRRYRQDVKARRLELWDLQAATAPGPARVCTKVECSNHPHKRLTKLRRHSPSLRARRAGPAAALAQQRRAGLFFLFRESRPREGALEDGHVVAARGPASRGTKRRDAVFAFCS